MDDVDAIKELIDFLENDTRADNFVRWLLGDSLVETLPGSGELIDKYFFDLG